MTDVKVSGDRILIWE